MNMKMFFFLMNAERMKMIWKRWCHAHNVADYTDMARCTHREKYILHMDLDLRSVENATMMKWTDF